MDVRAALWVLGGLLLGIGAERSLNMVLIGRPFDSFVTRLWIAQFAAAAGVVCLILAALIGRRR
jgi:hypothetical protein